MKISGKKALRLDVHILTLFYRLIYYSFSGIDDALSLSYQNVAFAFAILAFGLITALVQVVIEFMLRGLKVRGPNSDDANPDGLFKVVDKSQRLSY